MLTFGTAVLEASQARLQPLQFQVTHMSNRQSVIIVRKTCHQILAGYDSTMDFRTCRPSHDILELVPLVD